jgi:hypothetical protein
MGQYTSYTVLVRGEWEFGTQCHPTEGAVELKESLKEQR